MGALYRVKQFLRRMVGPQEPPDLGDFAALLTAEQKTVFGAMDAVDQQHCLAVAKALVAQGYTQTNLLQAGLLHDIGKSLGRIALWERVAYVLLSRWAPRLVGRVGSAQAGGVWHGLHLLAHHAELGAGLAAQAGSSPDVVALVHGDGNPQLQMALWQADDTH